MRIVNLVICFLMLAGLVSCGSKTKDGTSSEQSASDSITTEIAINDTDYTDLVKKIYDKFVFAIDSDVDVKPEDYFTANALRKLKDVYEYDCEDSPCYAYYALRTPEQDSKPGTNGESKIYDVERTDGEWYIVSYSDMGWPGRTRIKIVEGKIDDFDRLPAE